jgi:hypothetical protein
MPTIRFAIRMLAAAALLLAAAPAARAQSCWPVGILLAVRDAEGHRIDPARLDSVTNDQTGAGIPQPEVVAPNHSPVPGDTLKLLQWSRAGCHMQLKSVTLHLGGRVMQLVFDQIIDSEARREPSVLLFEAPAFQEGTFRVRWDPAEDAGHPPTLLRDRWTRIAGTP